MAIVFLIVLIVFVTVTLVWELATGAVPNRYWKRGYTRTGSPKMYWMGIASHSIILAAIVAMFILILRAFLGRH
jgi:ABC-type spermidine/putrescine transport system permease subunit I